MAANAQDSGSVDGTTLASIVVDGTEIPNLTSFSYTSDVLQIGDPFSVEIPDPRGRYIGKLPIGAPVEFSLTNKSIANGAKTKKIKGLITDRKVSSSDRGTIVRITGADIGWHLAHNDAPVWFNLRGITWERLATACVFPHKVFKGKKGKALDVDPKWGFTDISVEGNGVNRGLKLDNKRANAQQSAALQQGSLQVLFIQIEPGEKISDVLITYARRLNVLVNVSVEGVLQIFRPDYDQKSRYAINYDQTGTKAAKDNNILHVELDENLETTYSDVRVYGEVVMLSPDQQVVRQNYDPNVGKFNGRWPEDASTSPLKFTHRSVGVDHDPTGKKLATQRARWKYERGLFDAWTYSVTLRGHGQDGSWFESDTIATVVDKVLGVKGTYYVSAVQCSRDQQNGDRTVLTLRKKNLLASS